LKLSPHQYFNARLIGGVSDGDLPPQRQFGLGGIGSVHGYRFKESLGERMLLANLEYQVDMGSRNFRGLAFFDTGRVWHPIDNTRDDWLNGIGLGVELGDVRVEFGWRLDDIPSSLQVLVRLRQTF
jgi:outer membrane translocation and assembly module TamA